FRKGIAFEPAAQGWSGLFRDGARPLFRAPSGESGSNAIALSAGTSQLASVPSLSCLMLCAFGAARRCARDCREAEANHAGPGSNCGTLEDPRGSRILFERIALGRWRHA